MQLVCVPPARAQEFWPLARLHVCAALDRGGNLRSERDVEFDVLSGHALLWLVADGTSVAGALVTQLHDGACWIVAYGCDNHARSAPLLTRIEQFARDEGCAAVRFCGRKGWARALPDYRMVSIIMEKVLDQ